jgi:hypothetical protein
VPVSRQVSGTFCLSKIGLVMQRTYFASVLGFGFATTALAASHEHTLHRFNAGKAAEQSYSTLVSDKDGNLYGTTQGNPYASQGPVTDGTVFELSPPAAKGGKWIFTTLYRFTGGTDGAFPNAGVARDKKGNLFGSTEFGNVFRLAPPAKAGMKWTFTTLANANANPFTQVILDGKGNIYDVTFNGGIGNGSVFELSPPAAGSTTWTLTTLYSFQNGTDGAEPFGQLLRMADTGVIYGTTRDGGTTGCFGNIECGTVYQLVPQNGGWQETVLYVFNGGAGGASPYAGLVADKAGNLYGTASTGGSDDGGVVFELVKPAPGQSSWTQTVLANFDGANGDGPLANVVFADHAKLVGTTDSGGSGYGTVFELAPPEAGQTDWTLTTLYGFSAAQYGFPASAVLPGPKGVLYGASSGSFAGPGEVYAVKP